MTTKNNTSYIHLHLSVLILSMNEHNNEDLLFKKLTVPLIA